MITLSRKEIAERLRCSYRTLIRIEPLAGVIPAQTLAHGQLQFDARDVEKLRPFVRKTRGAADAKIVSVKQAKRRAGR